ncbi:MAG: UDP-3-O-acyl-N-acetylglucosamine deacetylase [Alphaproteobacteria bacterium]|jgi:UDP-3-O-[3-hydroxymyristoyl] N-acetylglucosamine deacetylase
MKKNVQFSGIGIHSGVVTNVSVKPSKKKGIFFLRTDLSNADLIPATWDNVQNTGLMSTSIGVYPNQVQTIEHFMAALFICGIDSAIIEIDGPEFPILDGGAKSFIEILQPITNVKNKIKKIIVKKEIIATRQEIIKKMPILKRIALWFHGLKTGRKEDGFVKLSPGKLGFSMDITLDYPDKIIGVQKTKFVFNETDKARTIFIKTIAKSRTFGRIWEWEYLKKRKMGLGANENNVIAINETGDGVLNNLYFPDEFVRHKLIDALGDFYTSGGMIVGNLKSVKGSHALNNLVLRKLFANPSNYEIKEE